MPIGTRKEYAGGAAATTLASGINSSVLTITLATGTGASFPDGSTGQFTIDIDFGTASAERILCDSRTGDVITVNASGRGFDGTTAVAHSVGTGNVTHGFDAESAMDLMDGVYSRAVLKTLFDANTILAATTDNTPAAVTMAANTALLRAGGNIEALAVAANTVLLRSGGNIEALAMAASTILARLASGNIVAATPAQLRTLLGIIAVVKTADQDVTSSTTYVNDNHLVFAVGASETWVADVVLMAKGDPAGDIKVQFTGPAGSALSVAAVAPALANTGFDGDGGWAADPASGTVGSSGVIAAGALGTTFRYRVTCVTAGTAGNCQLQWAQNASNGTATRVYAGSSLIAVRV